MIKITADSTCDLSPELLEQYGITLAPLHILVGSVDYRDGVDIQPEDIFRYVDKEGKTVRTAAVNVFEYYQLFEEHAPKDGALIHICISAEFSACYQNARLAAAEFDNVHVVDSRNLSTGSGHTVLDAAIMAGQGMPADEILSRLQQSIPRVDASFVIDRLDYLHKGGRCSGLEALGAKVLRIKPCIEVMDGAMQVGKKYRGKFTDCLDKYVRDRLEGQTNIDYSRVFITHCLCPQDVVERVRQSVAAYADFEQTLVTRAGCTISGHCGPNTLGILFKRTADKKAPV